jgi:hypothetical protein
MPLRGDFPDTRGAWVSAPGYPLVEIKADGTNVNVQSRPAGGRNISTLTEGEKAAYEYQSQAYFFGEEAAATFKQSAAIFNPISVVQTESGAVKGSAANTAQQAYMDAVNAQYAKDAAAAEAALASGSYVTPAPPPPSSHTVDDAPAAAPIVTTDTHSAIMAATDRSTAIVQTLDAPQATLYTPTGTPVSAAVAAAAGEPATVPWAMIGLALLGAGGLWLALRRGLL